MKLYKILVGVFGGVGEGIIMCFWRWWSGKSGSGADLANLVGAVQFIFTTPRRRYHETITMMIFAERKILERSIDVLYDIIILVCANMFRLSNAIYNSGHVFQQHH